MTNSKQKNPNTEFWISNRGIAFVAKISGEFYVTIYIPTVTTYDAIWEWSVETSRAFNYKQTAQRFIKRELGEV